MQNAGIDWSTIILKLIITLIPLLILLVFGGGFAFLIYRWSKARSYDPKRGQKLARIAQVCGWNFTQQSPIEAMPILSHYKLQGGKPVQLENLALGKLDNHQAAFFDLVCDITTGRTSRRVRQTVFALNSNSFNFPQFQLKPESVSDKIASSDINFPHHPSFSNKLFLTGQDKEAVARIFNGSVLEFYEKVFPFHTVAAGNHLFIFQSQVRIEPEQINSWIQMLAHLGKLFSRIKQ